MSWNNIIPVEALIPVTKQEIFDEVCTHLLTQNSKSEAISGECRYHGPNGKKCAIGALIPDELYSESLEGRNVFGLPEPVLLAIGVDIKDYDFVSFLKSLQCIHDNYSPNLWYGQLKFVAKGENLTFNPQIKFDKRQV